MAAASHTIYTNNILALQKEYIGGIMYDPHNLIISSEGCVRNSGFMGSKGTVCLTSSDSIIHEAPGCVAARSVNMVAKNAIKLGVNGQGDQPVPLRLYAPVVLTITTPHLLIGALKILEEPQDGFLFCEKITFHKSTEEEPPHFELVKSWAINDTMEVEVIPMDQERS